MTTFTLEFWIEPESETNCIPDDNTHHETATAALDEYLEYKVKNPTHTVSMTVTYSEETFLTVHTEPELLAILGHEICTNESRG